jgi:hypothetical protein
MAIAAAPCAVPLLTPAFRTRTSILCFALLLLLGAACKAPSGVVISKQDPQQTAQPKSDAAADLAALKLSEACAEEAEKYWQRGGFGSNGPTTVTYTSHYNTRTKKCYVSLQVFSTMPNGARSILEKIDDPIERVNVAELLSFADTKLDEVKPRGLSLPSDGEMKAEAITPESVARFRHLMTE